MSRITDIAVIGGGASGLAAAIEAKNVMPKARVVILEKLDRVGKSCLPQAMADAISATLI